jgi:regulator of cell morphogenesis and NO signaling
MTPPAYNLQAIEFDQSPNTHAGVEFLTTDYRPANSRPNSQDITRKGILAGAVLATLAKAAGVEFAATDSTSSPLTSLIRHIVLAHHAFIRSELPRLYSMAELSIATCAGLHPELFPVSRKLRRLAGDLTFNMNKEETILFRQIESLERIHAASTSVSQAALAGIEDPIEDILREHAAAAALLGQIRAETRSFFLPDDACTTLTGLYKGFEAFEHNLYRHLHLENNLLFPGAIALEKELLAA